MCAFYTKAWSENFYLLHTLYWHKWAHGNPTDTFKVLQHFPCKISQAGTTIVDWTSFTFPRAGALSSSIRVRMLPVSFCSDWGININLSGVNLGRYWLAKIADTYSVTTLYVTSVHTFHIKEKWVAFFHIECELVPNLKPNCILLPVAVPLSLYLEIVINQCSFKF